MPADLEHYERALAAMEATLAEPVFLKATRLLLTVMHNLYKHPDKSKYRKLKTKNETIAKLVASPTVNECLETLGFRRHRGENAYLQDLPMSLEQLEHTMDAMVASRKRLGVMEAWELFPQDLELGQTIGGGKFGKVYEGLLNDQKVAIKTMRKKSDPAALAEFRREAAVMSQLQHQNVIQLLGVVLNQHPPLLIMELMGACFLDLLKRCTLSEKDILDCALQIAAGLEYVHHSGYLHCDIACRNVLVANSGRLVLGDLGLARKMDSPECNLKGSKAKFPIRWTSPEVFQQQMLTRYSDIWSFGITLWEVVTQGGVPYEGLTNKEAKRTVKEGNTPGRPSNCPNSLYNIMQQCWRTPAEQRPHFDDLVHELISLKINLAHKELDAANIKEVNVGSHLPRKRKAVHKAPAKSWFFGRRRSRDLLPMSGGPQPTNMPSIFRVHTLLVCKEKRHVTVRINYADRAARVKSIILKKLGIDLTELAEYELVEVGANGVHSRIMVDDEYPLSLIASPFYNHMQEVYLCPAQQAEYVHECLMELQEEEVADYKRLLEAHQSGMAGREADAAVSSLDDDVAESGAPALALDPDDETEDGTLLEASGDDDLDEDQWLMDAEEESLTSASRSIYSGFSRSYRRRKLKSMRSMVYEALSDDERGCDQGPKLSETLYESDHDLDEEEAERAAHEARFAEAALDGETTQDRLPTQSAGASPRTTQRTHRRLSSGGLTSGGRRRRVSRHSRSSQASDDSTPDGRNSFVEGEGATTALSLANNLVKAHETDAMTVLSEVEEAARDEGRADAKANACAAPSQQPRMPDSSAQTKKAPPPVKPRPQPAAGVHRGPNPRDFRAVRLINAGEDDVRETTTDMLVAESDSQRSLASTQPAGDQQGQYHDVRSARPVQPALTNVSRVTNLTTTTPPRVVETRTSSLSSRSPSGASELSRRLSSALSLNSNQADPSRVPSTTMLTRNHHDDLDDMDKLALLMGVEPEPTLSSSMSQASTSQEASRRSSSNRLFMDPGVLSKRKSVTELARAFELNHSAVPPVADDGEIDI